MGGGAAGRPIGGAAGRAIGGGAAGRGGIAGGAAGFATVAGGFGAGLGAAGVAGFATRFAAGFAVFLRAAFAAGLRFAADLRADEALRAAVRRAGFRFAVFFRADALVAFFGLRDAAARLVFLGFFDLVAFAMIDLPILWAILFNALVFLARSYHYF
jgi:hypothetical protein